MKKLAIIALAVLLSMSAAYAGGFLTLHVGSASGGGGGGGGCTGTINLSTGCVQPMLR